MLLLQNKISLLALILIPLIVWWHLYLARKGHRHIRFSSRRLIPDVPGASKISLIRGLFPFKIFAVFLFIIALAGPQIRHDYQIEQNRGTDILLALDTSGSMGSIDFKPRNRLEVAKEVIANFVEKRTTDRLGLIIFAATAYTKCPLTVDYEILKTFLQETQLGELEDGTAIGMALATSINRIRSSSAKTKIIILLTDGNNNRGEIDPRDAARMAKDFNIKVYTVGVGTRGEAPYPVVDQLGQQQYVMVQVEIDETILNDIAKTTGGLYFRATDKDSLQNIFAEIDRWEKSKIAFKSYSETTELFFYFVIAGFFLLLLVEVARRTFLRTLP
jgi:Ca-activated chloride channel family protein